MTKPAPRGRSLWWRWAPLLLVFIGAVVVVGVDQAIRKTPDEGFCPTDATWMAAAENFGQFWEGVERSQGWERVYQEMGDPLADVALQMRKDLGIRPTPWRWSAWMGNRFLAAHASEGTGLCVYPGLLLRAVFWFRATFGVPPRPGGIYQYGRYFYAWRDGFFIVSPQEAYVRASLVAPAPQLAASKASDELRLYVPGAHAALVRLRGEDNWPIEGRIHVQIDARTTPLTLVDAWPIKSIGTVTASHWADIQTLLDLADQPLRGQPWRTAAGAFAKAVVQHWALEPLPQDWDRPTNQCSLSLAGIDTADILPIPAVAILLKNVSSAARTHPLAPLLSKLPSIPYEWNGERGFAGPVLGEELTLCLSQSGSTWIGATNEPLMASLAGRLKHGKGVDADVVIRLDWRQVSEALEKILSNAANYELIPGENTMDFGQDVLPAVKALGQLGTLSVNGKSHGSTLDFKGWLARISSRQAGAG